MARDKHGMKVNAVALALSVIQASLSKSNRHLIVRGDGFDLYDSSLVGGKAGGYVTYDNPETLLHFLNCFSGEPEGSEEADQIYCCYPRKRDPRASRLAIMRALRDSDIPTNPEDRPMYLAIATTLFAIFCGKEGVDKTFIPYPATWFNRQSYLNETQTTLRLLKAQQASPSSLTLKQKAEQICQRNAKPLDAWSQQKSFPDCSVPHTRD